MQGFTFFFSNTARYHRVGTVHSGNLAGCLPGFPCLPSWGDSEEDEDFGALSVVWLYQAQSLLVMSVTLPTPESALSSQMSSQGQLIPG